METSITSETARVEDRVEARVTRDVMADGRVAIPAGTRVIGDVTLVERGGKMKDKARLGVRFHTLVLADGNQVPFRTDAIFREGASPGDGKRSQDRRRRDRRRDPRRDHRRREGRGDRRRHGRRRRQRRRDGRRSQRRNAAGGNGRHRAAVVSRRHRRRARAVADAPARHSGSNGGYLDGRLDFHDHSLARRSSLNRPRDRVNCFSDKPLRTIVLAARMSSSVRGHIACTSIADRLYTDEPGRNVVRVALARALRLRRRHVSAQVHRHCFAGSRSHLSRRRQRRRPIGSSHRSSAGTGAAPPTSSTLRTSTTSSSRKPCSARHSAGWARGSSASKWTSGTLRTSSRTRRAQATSSSATATSPR